MLLECLKEVHDNRRLQARRYELHYVILFSIIAMMCGAISFRKIDLFIKSKFNILKQMYGLTWKKALSESNIRKVFNNLDKESLEQAFRKYSAWLDQKVSKHNIKVVACDGKELRRSYDNFSEHEAITCLSALSTANNIVLGHKFLTGKDHEIPEFQALLKELGLENCVWTADALHTQKKL